MRIDNNLGAMVSSQLQVNEMASNLSEIAAVTGDPEFQEVTGELIDSIVGQIPEIIAYTANAKGIETQSAALDALLNIKA